MTKTKTDSNQVSIHQHQDYTVKWCQILNSKQKWIVIKWPFLVEINGHGNIYNKLGVVGKGLTPNGIFMNLFDKNSSAVILTLHY